MLSKTGCARLGWCCGVALAAGVSIAASADVVTLLSVKDNTLYEEFSGSISNGAGKYFFVGEDNGGHAKRGMILFDLSSIPPGSTITSVRLMLNCSRARTNPITPVNVTVHRLLADWGEGISDAGEFGGEEGGGDLAEPGDATWLYRYFPDVTWTTPGGQFVPGASASLTVSSITQYQWTSVGLLNDVIAWHNGSAPNHGWLLRTPEVSTRTAKRFDSREIENPALAPRLEVTFQPPACPGDADGDTMVGLSDLAVIITNWFVTGAPGTLGDLDNDGMRGLADLSIVINNWGNDC